MFVSIYYKPSLFNAHTMIFIVHIFMNVNKLCLNQTLPDLVTPLKAHSFPATRSAPSAGSMTVEAT